MQIMERIHQLPRPVMPPTWREQMIGQIPFAITATLCVLLGAIGFLFSPEAEVRPFQGHLSTDLRMASHNTELVELVSLTYPEDPITPLMTSGEPDDVVRPETGPQEAASVGEFTVDNAVATPQSTSATTVASLGTARWVRIVSGSVQKIAEVRVDNDSQWSIMESVPDAHVYVYGWTNGIMHESTTLADGSFQLEIPALEEQELGPSGLTVMARHPQYSYGWTKLSEDNLSNAVVKLYMPNSIAGKVINEEGQGVDGAIVRVIRIAPVSYPSAPPPLPEVPLLGEYFPGSTVKTDSKGDFVISSLPASSKATFQITALGYAREPGAPSIEAGTRNVRFELKREARIQGRVLFSEAGTPATGMKIRAEGVPPTMGWDEAKTDENGNYMLTNLLPGKYDISLVSQHKHITHRKEEPPYWVSVPIDNVTVVSGPTVKGIDLELVKGGLITGRVTDAETNEPIPNHTIFLRRQDVTYRTMTDENGFYRFRSAPGDVSVYAYNIDMEKPGIMMVLGHVDLVEGVEISNKDFQFGHIALFGHVLSPDYKPVGGARIWDRVTGQLYTESDGAGTFTINGAIIGNGVWLKAEHRALQLRGYSEPNHQPGSGVNIVMERYQFTSASGRVVNEDGKPIPLVHISLRAFDSEARDGGGTSSWGLKTDNSGHYTVSGRSVPLIIGDEYAIVAKAEGYAEGSTKTFVAKADMPPLEDITLSAAK